MDEVTGPRTVITLKMADKAVHTLVLDESNRSLWMIVRILETTRLNVVVRRVHALRRTLAHSSLIPPATVALTMHSGGHWCTRCALRRTLAHSSPVPPATGRLVVVVIVVS